MNSLTPSERARLISSGLISMPGLIAPAKRSKPVQKRKTKPIPAAFTGTPKERAEHAVTLAKTGIYALTKCAIACGYYGSASAALKELVSGCGPLTDICRNCLETGRVNAPASVNTASLRLIRDFYGLPNINGETDGVQELREFLKKHETRRDEIASLAWLHPETLRHFVRGRHGMTRAVMNRVRDAAKEIGLL